MGSPDFPMGYLSPETLLPAASILATIAGVVMMIGSRTTRFALRWLGRVVRLARSARGVPALHFGDRGASLSRVRPLATDPQEPGDTGRGDR